MEMIKLDQIRKIYRNGTVANDNITLKVTEGDILGVVGANGAGKTTLMRVISGLSRQTSGDVTVGNLRPNSRREHTARLISFFSQKTASIQSQRAFEVVYFTGIYRGLSRTEAREQAAELMEYFGLSALSKRYLNELSGGQEKLVMLAGAFIGNYPIVILDEPTNDLDPVNRWQLWDLVKERNEKYHTTFLIVSHNMSELESIARTAVIVHEGRVADAGGIQSLKEKYSKGYRVSLKCDRDDVEGIAREIGLPHTIDNHSEVIVQIGSDQIADLLPRLTAFAPKCEIRIYRNTLYDVFHAVREESIHA
ncbi:MAG: ABC transporter ATP-binding protein [Clostridium sp.]|jgi:ABC-2 type transport system ATP-binding protein|nr:ABC transporter ATP-binding protein [Clostridium sp.]